jgi:hypothetical protein
MLLPFAQRAPSTTSPLKIFNINPNRCEVWEVDAAGNKVTFRGRFYDQAKAALYINGQLRAVP